MHDRIKFYYPKEHYDSKRRGRLFPFLKPFIKRGTYTDEERQLHYDISERDYKCVSTIAEADIVILTMDWNYYVENGKTNLADSLVKECEQASKPLFIIINGDYGYPIPDYANSLVLRLNGEKSKFSKNHLGVPAFIGDPLKIYYNTSNLFLRAYRQYPTIGFCGQAINSKIQYITDIGKAIIKKGFHEIGVYSKLPQKIQSTTYNRYRYMRRISDCKKLRTNFIFRDKHVGGINKKSGNPVLIKEFYDNIRDSDYTVCYRGAGNFSIRFFETLAMGRIPIFIDSDCFLPLEDKINWKEHCVWINEKEIDQINNKIIEFHNSLGEEAFKELQFTNRQLWEDKLRFGGFFKALFEFAKRTTEKH